MSSLVSFPDGKLSFPGEPIQIPNDGKVRLRLELKNSKLQFFYAVGPAGNFQPAGPELDASIVSDECGGHAEHGSFTGAFVCLCAHDLNGTAAPADFSYLTYEPEKGSMDA
jgi:xylan 1,4-beta-xylosidase